MQITISALAAQLGELEPPNCEDDTESDHFRRQDVVFGAARLLPVRSPEDAALALSGIVDKLIAVLANDVTAAQRTVAMEDAVRIAARIAAWLRDAHGAHPLAGVWPGWADPFTDVIPQERVS